MIFGVKDNRITTMIIHFKTDILKELCSFFIDHFSDLSADFSFIFLGLFCFKFTFKILHLFNRGLKWIINRIYHSPGIRINQHKSFKEALFFQILFFQNDGHYWSLWDS